MISVTLWRRTLVAHDACPEGMALFELISGLQPENDARRLDRIRIRRWTPLHSIWPYVAGFGAFAGWLENQGLIPRANLAGANLAGANLDGANLDGANLAGAYRGSSSSIPGWHTLTSGYLERATTAEATG